MWNKGWADGFDTQGDTNPAVDRRHNKKQAEAKTILDLIALDREHALLLVDYLRRWMRMTKTRTVSDFKTLDEWIPFRFEDVASP